MQAVGHGSNSNVKSAIAISRGGVPIAGDQPKAGRFPKDISQVSGAGEGLDSDTGNLT
ncbi:hypothetical protein SPB21_00215 [Leptothoe sp. ISB3NOV94-8A]|uniref:hypothetical protein n=1 Tax=Adonisia turfae TaxID=2950184 RepID=UPI0013D46514|nr:hypothetical protein [Adonisia turfae]